ncbi:hypothetical protein Pa4123_04580 [Phytohabitans aurantiacus]|uniref:Uncharacterized protein n=1 Tax=Phytohabitans aurantiacus TaxID=3016789 RepID=A0ABQ5QKM0_9ACTN|nr:hypothetical protein Pa4123_04580 [Phytohabitans aurantiacus]
MAQRGTVRERVAAEVPVEQDGGRTHLVDERTSLGDRAGHANEQQVVVVTDEGRYAGAHERAFRHGDQGKCHGRSVDPGRRGRGRKPDSAGSEQPELTILGAPSGGVT